MLRTFTIPRNAEYTYPPPRFKNENLGIDSWFTAVGAMREPVQVQLRGNTQIRCRRVWVKFNRQQLDRINRWFEIYRIVYNVAVKYTRTHPLPNSGSLLRSAVKPLFSQHLKDEIWRSKIPVHTVDNAIFDVHKAYVSSFALHRDAKRRFRIRYKKFDCRKTLVLEKSAFSKVKNAFAITSLGVVNTPGSWIIGIKHDTRLTTYGDKHFLNVPEDIEDSTVSFDDRVEICSLDPGTRTFQTVYDINGDIHEFGSNYTELIRPMLDKLTALHNYRRENWHWRWSRRIRRRIRNLTDELHWKVARWLASNFNTILIGNMSTKGILGGDLTAATKRVTQAQSHYTFRMRLREKCSQFGSNFLCVDESYTSKTCGKCGQLNQNLGGSKRFRCVCGWDLDRDHNAARNIMIKTLQ